MNQRRKAASTKRTAEAQAEEPRPPLLPYLRGILASLNPTERLIAECVIKDPQRVITSSVADLGQACGASAGAIVGFCQKLGLKGFSDFRIALAQDLARGGLPAGDTPQNGSLFERVFQFHAQSLAETARVNPQPAFERVAQALEKARRIEFFSIGLSFPVAHTAAAKFLLLGLPVLAQFDSHLQLISATQMKAGDLAFGISLSGTTRETVHCLEVAKARGATTVCLTNAMKSPITDVGHLALYGTPSELNYFQAPLASRVTQLAVIDALFVSLASKHRKRTAERLQQSGQELLKRRLE